MRHRPPLEYDVSVTADKARRARRRGVTGAVDGAERRCEHPGCTEPGLYRAPADPTSVHRYRWFCLTHIRDYNAAWNFFRDHDPDALDAQIAADRVWDRPTWAFGRQPQAPAGTQGHVDGRAWERFGFRDPMELLGARATLNPGRSTGNTGRGTAPEPRRPRLPRGIANALEVLGAEGVWSKAEIRSRYRALVKQLHPDMNGGDRSEEGRLRKVLWAWEQIKNARGFDP